MDHAMRERLVIMKMALWFSFDVALLTLKVGSFPWVAQGICIWTEAAAGKALF